MKMEIKTISPEIAEQYLTLNISENRNRSISHISFLTGIIKRGEWIVSHQGIAFDWNGNLIDGQHRLKAIVSAGISVPVAVFTNCDPESYKILDGGKKRTLSDQTRINTRAAEVCRYIGVILGSRKGVTSDQCLNLYETPIGKLHDSLIDYYGSQKGRYANAAIRVAATLSLVNGSDPQYIKDLYKNLNKQNFLDLPPIAHSFIRQINSGKLVTTNNGEYLCRVIKLFNPNLKDQTRLTTSDTDISNCYEYVRNTMYKFINKENF